MDQTAKKESYHEADEAAIHEGTAINMLYLYIHIYYCIDIYIYKCATTKAMHNNWCSNCIKALRQIEILLSSEAYVCDY